MARKNKRGNTVFFSVSVLIGLGFVAAIGSTWLERDTWKPGRVVMEETSSDKVFPVVISRPESHPLVDSGKVDAHGHPVMVRCATCHDTREPNDDIHRSEDLDQFHQGLNYAHGGQSCLSCHHAGDYDHLRKADGETLEFSESMMLCAQCHSLQHRDYLNGSHGGMTGYWDLTRGGRQRHSCVDCHDPHRPAYPKVLPVFPPKAVIGEHTEKDKDHE